MRFLLQRLANISEEPGTPTLPLSPNERILQNETSVERNEYIDPVTGAATMSLVERSVTQREVSVNVQGFDLISVICLYWL